MKQLISINEIRKLYPDEWVLLGNPITDDRTTDIVAGVPLFHSKDKKEVCYTGRDKTSGYDKITIIVTKTFHRTRKTIGLLNRI
jgi:hypothetical protein